MTKIRDFLLWKMFSCLIWPLISFPSSHCYGCVLKCWLWISKSAKGHPVSVQRFDELKTERISETPQVVRFINESSSKRSIAGSNQYQIWARSTVGMCHCTRGLHQPKKHFFARQVGKEGQHDCRRGLRASTTTTLHLGFYLSKLLFIIIIFLFLILLILCLSLSW